MDRPRPDRLKAGASLRIAVVAILLLVAVGHTASADAGPYQVAVPVVYGNLDVVGPHPFGAQMYGPLSDETISHASVRQARLHWIRWEVSWGQVEPVRTDPPTYNWPMDEDVEHAMSLGLEVIATFVSNPAWASMKADDGAPYINGPIEDEDLPEFAQFVAAMAQRYPNIKYYEFFNEPDNGSELAARYPYGGPYWGPFPDKYAAMLAAVYPALKEANPDAQVVFGGVASDWFSDLPEEQEPGPFERYFVHRVLEIDRGQHFDVMNFHYYPFFAANWSSYGPGILGKTRYIAGVLAQYGVDKPIICTEVGEGSVKIHGTTDDSSPEYQARVLAQEFARSVAADLDAVIWWLWKDLADPSLGSSGLLTTALEPKVAVQAFRTATQKLGRVAPVEVMDLGVGIEAYSYATPSGAPVYVLWTTDGQVRAVSLPLSSATKSDIYGAATAIADGDDGAWDGHVVVAVGADPIYVEAN